jgi:hypothetical protein
MHALLVLIAFTVILPWHSWGLMLPKRIPNKLRNIWKLKEKEGDEALLHTRSESGGSLDLVVMQVPVQTNHNYIPMITEYIPKEKVLRWYISRVDEQGMATVEIVVDESRRGEEA